MNPEETPQTSVIPQASEPQLPPQEASQPSQAATPTPLVQPQQQPTPQPRRMIHGSIEAITEPGEKLIFRTKKHPFGLVVMYLEALFGFILASGLMLYLVPGFFGEDQQVAAKSWVLIIVALFGAIMVVILLVVTYIYSSNELILTDRNVTQIIRNGLFDKQVSQLSLNNVEDVTAEKHGLFPMLFNFGQVRVETAGEQNNFHFQYCPRPNHYGQLLLDTRAECIGRGNSPPH